jgi:methanogenic corrinoid protein MtbC1
MSSLQQRSPPNASHHHTADLAEHDSTPAARRSTITRLMHRYGLLAGGAAARRQRVGLISRTLEVGIVPKLVLNHRAASGTPAIVTHAELAAFTRQVLDNEIDSCRRTIDDLIAHGATLPQVCVDLLAPAARTLGEMWEADLFTFAEVASGLGLLHGLLHALHDVCEAPAPFLDSTRRALLVSLPDEHHSFGLQMVGELFRHAGWDVTLEPALAESEMIDIVAETRFSIAGFTISTEEQSGPLALAIHALRRASANPDIGVMVGGPMFSEHPDLAALLGADVGAADGHQAVLRAEGLHALTVALSKAKTVTPHAAL